MITRREMLKATSTGFGFTALAGLCSQELNAAYNSSLATKRPHFEPHVTLIWRRTHDLYA